MTTGDKITEREGRCDKSVAWRDDGGEVFDEQSL